MTVEEKLSLCSGCRNDFYNDQNPLGVKRCWSFKSARVVRRFKLGWFTQPDTPRAVQEVVTLSCHHAPGHYALMERPPGVAVDVVRIGRKR